jgi:hypothetical protein
VRGQRSLLALSSRPWLGYSDQGRWTVMPLTYESLGWAAVGAGMDGDMEEGSHVVAQGGT